MQNKSIKDFWCFFPFDGMTVEPSGNVKPCPIWCTDEDHLITDLKTNPEQTINGIFETSKLKKMRSHMRKGIPFKGCQQCWDNEKNGLQSKRLHKIAREVSNTKIKFDDDFCRRYKKKLKTIELNFSNTCNLACAMCNRTHSSGWVQQEKTMPKELMSRVEWWRREWGDPFHNFKPFIISDTFINSVVDNINEFKSIMIKGGEPLYDKRCIKFLDTISKLNPDIHLIIVTNASVVTEHMEEVLGRFNNLELNISIDGIKETYEWIRGYDWNKIANNYNRLSKLKTKQFGPNVSVSMYNLHQLGDMINYFNQFKPNTQEYIMSFGIVHEPWMSCNLIGSNDRDKFLKNIAPALERYTPAGEQNIKLSNIELQNLVKKINHEHWIWPGFLDSIRSLSTEYIQWLDGLRKKPLKDISPFIFNIMTGELNKNNGQR